STAAQSAKPTATFERRGLPAQTFANHPRINANAWIPAFAGMTEKRRSATPNPIHQSLTFERNAI
ncbi:MAG: hypothetical protein KA375_17005, partial [Vitreoscilla sp.]|nr:hypothetical protein [Vitreoscilla sp.]